MAAKTRSQPTALTIDDVISNDEIIRTLRRLRLRALPANIGNPNDDGISDINRYILDAYGIKVGIRPTQTTADVYALKPIQNGIEVPRMSRLAKLDIREYQDLVEKNPVKVLSTGNGSFIINGNNRILYSILMDGRSIPIEYYQLRKRDFYTQADLDKFEAMQDSLNGQNAGLRGRVHELFAGSNIPPPEFPNNGLLLKYDLLASLRPYFK